MQPLKGKTVFVTGASSGIGQATALEFARLGCRMLLAARRLDRLTDLSAALTEAGAEDVLNLKLDVRDRAAVEDILGNLPEDWREIDILVNNAGLSRGLTRFYEDDIDNWEEMIDTNVKGLLYVTRAIVPGMVARGSGHVINLGSIAGHGAYPNGSVYCATKSAELVISDGLRMDLLGKGVRVTSVDPGIVETAFSEIRFRGDKDRADKVYSSINALQATDIADAIVWCATRPQHVQIQTLLLTPTDQASGTLVNRKS